jgi:hypothetical protein
VFCSLLVHVTETPASQPFFPPTPSPLSRKSEASRYSPARTFTASDAPAPLFLTARHKKKKKGAVFHGTRHLLAWQLTLARPASATGEQLDTDWQQLGKASTCSSQCTRPRNERTRPPPRRAASPAQRLAWHGPPRPIRRGAAAASSHVRATTGRPASRWKRESTTTGIIY